MAASLSSGVSGRRILAVVKKQLAVLPCAQYRTKIKVKKPKPMERRVYEEVLEPLYPVPPISKVLKYSCLDPNSQKKKKKEDDENPYETFLIGLLRKEIESSKMIIICHSLPIIPPRQQLIKMQLRLEGIHLGMLSNNHMKMIIQGTKLANLAPLLVWNNIRITSPEPQVKTVVTKLKKFPEFQIIGGFVEDRLVSRQDLLNISQMPDIEQQRGELVSILSHHGGANTRSLLNHHQQNLVTNLQQYKSQSEKS